MRSLALGLVAAASTAGCNQIFGLSATGEIDAAIQDGSLPPVGHVALTYQLLDDTGGNALPIAFPNLTAPIITLGVGQADPQPVAYASDGTVAVPVGSGADSGMTAPYRLIYQVDASDLPHEVQWDLLSGHLVVPTFGHLVRTPPPASSGYEFKPGGAPTASLFTVVFTTGMWTAGKGTMTLGDSIYPFASAASITGGPLGTPKVANGDVEIVAELDVDVRPNSTPNPGSFVTGFAKDSVDLTAGSTTLAVTAGWKTPVVDSFTLVQSVVFDNRISVALGAVLATGENESYAAGVVPDLTMPCFTTPGLNGALDTTMMVTLASYPSLLPANFVVEYVNPFKQTTTMLPAFVETQQQIRHLSGGGNVASGLQTQISTTGGMMMASFPAAMPGAATLGSTPLTKDDQMITVTGPFVTLTFSTESPPLHDDDFLVTLFEVDGATLTPKRTFQVLTPSVLIPTSILDEGKTYGLKIVGRDGYPGAQHGDYEVARSPAMNAPFSIATLFPGTFLIHKG